MAPMFVKIVVLCVVGIAITEVACDGVQVKTLEIKNNPNDYFGDIVSEVKPQDDYSSISITVPIKKDLDESLQLKANLKFNNIPILKDHVISLCDAISDDGFFKPIIEKIEPSGKFPTACPIPAGDWKITDYKLDTKDYLPFGLSPSGDFDAELDIGLPDAEPLIKVIVSGSVAASTGSLDLGSIFKLL